MASLCKPGWPLLDAMYGYDTAKPVVQSSLLYNAETWTSKEQHKRKLKLLNTGRSYLTCRKTDVAGNCTTLGLLDRYHCCVGIKVGNSRALQCNVFRESINNIRVKYTRYRHFQNISNRISCSSYPYNTLQYHGFGPLMHAISFIVIGIAISEAFVQQTMKDETVRSVNCQTTFER